MKFYIDNMRDKELFKFLEEQIHKIESTDIVLATDDEEFIWGDSEEYVEEGTPIGIEIFKESANLGFDSKKESIIFLFNNIFFKNYS